MHNTCQCAWPRPLKMLAFVGIPTADEWARRQAWLFDEQGDAADGQRAGNDAAEAQFANAMVEIIAEEKPGQHRGKQDRGDDPDVAAELADGEITDAADDRECQQD